MSNETTITAADQLKALKSKEAILKKQIVIDKKKAKEDRSNEIIHRNKLLKAIDDRLKRIQNHIFHYKRLGKSAKVGDPILETISRIVNHEPIIESDPEESVESETTTA